uniref:Uncharacterized protein n=1 Tax=Oryza glumipatula TaxID=40148 RepID=A0A0D9ZXR5_9ORYZ
MIFFYLQQYGWQQYGLAAPSCRGNVAILQGEDTSLRKCITRSVQRKLMKSITQNSQAVKFITNSTS